MLKSQGVSHGRFSRNDLNVCPYLQSLRLINARRGGQQKVNFLPTRFESMSFVVNILACKLKKLLLIEIEKKDIMKMVDRDTVGYRILSTIFIMSFFQFLLLTIF